MQCSCPDWAVPCKHLAAVIYMISREIDNNPFLVFEMHGVNLMEELAKRGIGAESTKKETEIPTEDTLFGLSSNPAASATPLSGNSFKRIDFSTLENHTEMLLQLLPDNPSFATRGNFKSTYATTLKKVQRSLDRVLGGVASAGKVLGVESYLRLTEDSKIQTVAATDTIGENIMSLLSLNLDALSSHTHSVIAAHQALMTAIHLIKCGCVAPRIVCYPKVGYAIFWMPAEIDNQVRNVISELTNITPPDIVVFPKEKRRTYPQEPAKALVSLYITHLISKLAPSSASNDDIYNVFFKNKTVSLGNIGDTERPGAVKAWIDHLWSVQGRYQPVFSFIDDEEKEQVLLHLAVSDRQHPESRVIALSEVIGNDDYMDRRFIMLRPFALIATLIKGITEYIDRGAAAPLTYSYEEFAPLLLDVIPIVKTLDIKVYMPKSFVALLRPKATMQVSRKNSDNSMFGLKDLLSFSWKVAVGDTVISLDEFEKLMSNNATLLKFKGQFVYTSPDDLKKIHDTISKTDKLSDGKLLQTVLSGEYESAPIQLSDEVKELIKKLTQQEEIPLPADINAALRPYQQRGFSWMYRNMRIGFGSILADDMGLGKTLQTITLIAKLKEENALSEKRILIVAPTGLLSNWMAEVERFAPNLSCEMYHGGARSLRRFHSDILLTTYGMVRTDAAKLKRQPWRLMVIDEAQNIKNHTAQQSKAVCSIPADIHIALSGTPVENRLSEFWSIMNYTNRGYLDTEKDFHERFAKPIQQQGDAACAERFRKITAPFMMRRMKTDKSIISDLPDKIEKNDYVTLLPDQAALYQTTLDAAMESITAIKSDDNKQLFKRQGLILQMILALKQICNHPALFLKNGDFRPDISAKVQTLLDNIAAITDAGEKVLVFTQFKQMGDMLERFIAEKTGRQPLFYHGGCSISQRNEIVERFQNNTQDRALILSLKAAGTGLNLTAASHVIHYDLWWNPAVEAQATDRAYRIGQNKNVIVHRFITRGTFEERIDDMIQKKKALADMTVASGESWIGKLSNDELQELFG